MFNNIINRKANLLKRYSSDQIRGFIQDINKVFASNPKSWAIPTLEHTRHTLVKELDRRQTAKLRILGGKLRTQFEIAKIKLEATKDIWAK